MRRAWLDRIIPRIPEITRDDVMWVIVGVLIVTLYWKFPVNWDAVFGWR